MLKEQFNINLPFINENDIVLIEDDVYGDTYTFKEPIEHPFYSGFYIVPTNIRFAVSKTAIVIDLWRNCNLNFSITKPIAEKKVTGGYRTSRHGPRHRMMALAFKQPFLHPKRLWVNHINGTPGDDRIDNLEWVTPSQNVQHAYDQNLHPEKVRAIDAKNIKTGNVYSFSNIAQAVRHTGLSHSCISGRLARYNGNVYPDGWLFKDVDDEWEEINPLEYMVGNERTVLVKSVIDDSVRHFYSVADCAKQLKINQPTIAKACREKVTTPNMGFIFRYVDDSNEFPQFSERQKRLYKYQDYPAVVSSGVIGHNGDGQETFFGTLTEAAKYYGYSESGLRGLIRQNKEVKGDRLELIYRQGN